MKLKFKKLHPNAQIPRQGTEFSGGWDVTMTSIEYDSTDLVICKLGFALEIPEGYKLTLVPRSSLTKTRWILQNTPGLGDSDYRGEYQYRFRALPENINMFDGRFEYPNFPYDLDDRIGQIYLEEVIPMEFEVVEELDNTVRGEGGFGSTNLK